MDKLNEQISRMKTIMGIKESIRASEATNQIDSILTVLDGRRNLAFFTFGDLTPKDKITVTKLINSDPTLNSLHIKKNPLMGFVIYREGYEKQAQELANLADKYGGYLSVNATKEDSIRIGQLLDYDPQDIQDYINKNYDVNIQNGKLNEFDSPDQNSSAISSLGLDEAAKTVNDLPADTGLYIKKHTTHSLISLVLYSASEDKLFGAIKIAPTNEDPNVYTVVRVSGDKGWGPLMYDIAMSYIHPKPLTPDRSGNIAKEAVNVWKFYYDKRSDIKKEPIDINDRLYSTLYPYETELDKEEIKNIMASHEGVKYELGVYNTKYSGKPSFIKPLILNARKNKMKHDTLGSRSDDQYAQLKGWGDF